MSDADGREPGEGARASTRAESRAAHDSSAPRVTLPETDGDALAGYERLDESSEVPLDAWNAERLQRSSFPPEGTAAPRTSRRVSASFVPVAVPAAPATSRQRRASLAPVADEESGDALSLVQNSSSSLQAVDLIAELEDRFSLDDFTGALRVAEFMLGRDPDDAVAAQFAKASRRKLEQLLYTRLTQHGAVPIVAVREAEVRWLGLDRRTAWLLSRIDGASDCDSLIEDVGLQRLEGLKLLIQLLDVGAIRMR